jgi:hypothetical protein
VQQKEDGTSTNAPIEDEKDNYGKKRKKIVWKTSDDLTPSRTGTFRLQLVGSLQFIPCPTHEKMKVGFVGCPRGCKKLKIY